MKAFQILLIILLDFTVMLLQAQIPLPPQNLNINPLSLVVTWQAPQSVLIDENFEGQQFPPAGWLVSSNGQGWDSIINGSFEIIQIPGHTKYVIANDQESGESNDGCCDYLILPAVDLTGYPNYKLEFQSFFTGNYGQKATLDFTQDDGATWTTISEIDHFPNWKQYEADLSGYSGTGGLSNVRFAFHSDDLGKWGSGWAVDDVKLYSDSLGIQNYILTLNQITIDQTTDTVYHINPELVTFNQPYDLCVSSQFNSGYSNQLCESFVSTFVYPPVNLQSEASNGMIHFMWEPPLDTSAFVCYVLYQNGVAISQIPEETSISFPVDNGELCIELTALHDLTSFGYPGQVAESEKVKACGYYDSGFDPPFIEDWTSASFTLNQWNAGTNWNIDAQTGNESPSARFSGSPQLTNYESTLMSWYFDATEVSPCNATGIGMMYSINLIDQGNSGTESLIIRITTDQGDFTLAEYNNSGNIDWLNNDIDLTSLVAGTNFRICFIAKGENSSEIHSWNVDNIIVYLSTICFPPGFDMTLERQGDPENDILISWSLPDEESHNSISGNSINFPECDTVGYYILRRDYSQFPAGPNNSGTGEWEWIAGTPYGSMAFLDKNLDNSVTNCYEYTVGYVTPGGSSMPVNMAWTCIYVNSPEPQQSGLTVYPNPADEWVRILSPGDQICSLELRNSLGKHLGNYDLSNPDEINVPTTDLPDGIYFLTINSADGVKTVQKLIVKH